MISLCTCSPFRSILSTAGEETLVFCLVGCQLGSTKVHDGVDNRIAVTKFSRNRDPEQKRKKQSWGWSRNQGRTPKAQVVKGIRAGSSPWGNAPSSRRPLGGRVGQLFSSLGTTSSLWAARHDDNTSYSCSGVRAPAVWVEKQYLLHFWLVTGNLTGYCLWGSFCPSDWNPTWGDGCSTWHDFLLVLAYKNCNTILQSWQSQTADTEQSQSTGNTTWNGMSTFNTSLLSKA